MTLSLNTNDMKRQIKAISKNYAKYETEIEKRTLNGVSKKAITKTARETSQESGLKVGTVKKGIKETKAKTNNLVVTWFIKSRRLIPPGLRALKKKGKAIGISFFGLGKKRKSFIRPVEAGGSPPFVIEGHGSGAKVAVFVPSAAGKSFRIKGTNKWGGRKVKTFAGHSLAYYIQYVWGSEDLLRQNTVEYIRDIFPEERKRQIARYQYVKARKTNG